MLIASVVQNFPSYQINDNPIYSLMGHDGMVWSTAYSPDGRTIGSISGNSIILWDAITGRELRRLASGRNSGGLSISFNHNGQRVAVSTGDNIKILDINSGRVIHTLTGQSSPASVLFSRDGTKLVSGSSFIGDSTVRIWDADRGRSLQNIRLGRRNVYTGQNMSVQISGLAFSQIKLVAQKCLSPNLPSVPECLCGVTSGG